MLVVLFQRLGPYHHARLKALGPRCKLTGIEFSAVDNTYAWDVVSADNGFSVISLFGDTAIENESINVVRSRVAQMLDSVRPLAVAIPGWSSRAALATLEWCCMTKTPAILMSDSTAHDEPRHRCKEWIKSRVVRLFSSALVAGAPHAEYVAALGLSRSRAFIGYDVVDNAYFSTKADEARSDRRSLRERNGLPDRYFLASNRFIEKKNLPRLLEAYASYVSRTETSAWDLVLLGDGPLKTMLLEQAGRLGVANRVHFPGFKQYDELPIFYGLASAFVHASTSEQWGLVVNEGMASGLPVLVSERCGCATDLVNSGINGETFDPHDTEDMACRMLQMSRRSACKLTAMGESSREIIENWSPETFASNMLKATDAALVAPRPRANWFDRALLWALMRR